MEKKKLSLKEIGVPRLLIIFLCGVMLIILSFPDLFCGRDNKSSQTKELNTVVTSGEKQQSYETVMERRLMEALKDVEGIGKVKVMITLKSSKERVTLKDTPYTKETIKEEDSTGGNRTTETVDNKEESVLQSTDGETSPYVVKELEPEVEGVLVVAQGGDSITIITEIVDAVEVLFDVPAHKIKVMKMNPN